jgi:ribosomal protein S18 acetylase RimI-like enzyme
MTFSTFKPATALYNRAVYCGKNGKAGKKQVNFAEPSGKIGKLWAFLTVYENFHCWVYRSNLRERDGKDFAPGTGDFVFQIVTSLSQAEELEDSGYSLVPHRERTRDKLSKGAAAGMIFVGKELASMEWVATDAAAKAGIDIYPCPVDFQHGEAYAGGVWTNQKYRGLGLHSYVYYRIYDFLREQGIKSVVSIVEVNNTAALKAHEKFAPEEKIVARAHYLRLLGRHFWRETAYTPGGKYSGIDLTPAGDYTRR